MKCFKFYRYSDPNMGWGEAYVDAYVFAADLEEAKEKWASHKGYAGWRHDPLGIDYGIDEIPASQITIPRIPDIIP